MTNAETASETVVMRKTKPAISAPCVYEVWDEVRNKDVPVYPAVNCSYGCDRCGWNPEVKEQRIAKIRESLQRR